MNLITLVWGYLKDRPMNTVLNIFMLALGIAVMTVLLLFTRQFQEKITSQAKGIDLVVGAKGSPLQLILCSIFHVDFPTGNIKVSDAEKVARHRLVKKAIPLALGDSYEGYRIVGTDRSYSKLLGASLATGKWWMNDLEVTLGFNVAVRTGLKVGDKLISAHGLTRESSAHASHAYVVKGVMKKQNSVIDDLILTNVRSIWAVHELETDTALTVVHPSLLVPGVDTNDSTKEITALLIQFRNPLAIIQLPRFVNGIGNLQAASPAFETARLFSILGVGVEVIRGFAYLLVFISGLSIFIALYNSLKERKYDLAIMRTMGASRTKLFASVVLEGLVLTILGSFIGIGLGHGALALFTSLIVENEKTGVSAWAFYPAELYVFSGSVMLGFICSVIPAIVAYRTDIHKVLAGN